MKKINPKIKISSQGAFTLIELLVVISIIALLAGLAIPGVTKALTRGQLVQALSNARQIHLQVQGAALDRATTGIGIGWPGNGDATGSGAPYNSAKTFITDLVNNGAMAASDLKIFATVGCPPAPSPTALGPGNVGFFIYNVSEADEGNVVFLTTKNLDYVDSETPLTLATTGAGNGFGLKGCVIFRKGGDGAFYNKEQLQPPVGMDAERRVAVFGTPPLIQPHKLEE